MKFKIILVSDLRFFPHGADGSGTMSNRNSNLGGMGCEKVFGFIGFVGSGGRALLLLASQGLIELDAAQLPRALDDTDVAVINTNYAIEAGLVPTRDALFVESK